MTVVRGIALDLDTQEVLRRAGVRQPSGPSAPVVDAVAHLMAQVEAERLLKPAVACETCAVAEVEPDHVRLQGGTMLLGPLLASTLSSATELAVAVATVGGDLEEEASRCFRKNEALRGLLLDAIGSAAVDSLTQKVASLVSEAGATKGYQASCPASPGMTGFPLSEQREVLRLAHADEIGVQVTGFGVMVPRKSVSLVFGLGPHVAGRGTTRGCAYCTLNRTCAQRRLKRTDALIE
ncbi:MAG: hypothetical protein HYY01_10610 [Chloroflexi bacterium]|nr:hypothetical protein [Chloroflexota bacterium]